MSGLKDLTFPTEEGVLNFRVGAIIVKNGKVLVAVNNRDLYYYSVGGRVKLNETTEAAVKREVYEETGHHLEIERLIWIHENFFMMRAGEFQGLRFHEISFYYLMRVPDDFEPEGLSIDPPKEVDEKMVWLNIGDLSRHLVYPEMYQKNLQEMSHGVMHHVTIDLED